MDDYDSNDSLDEFIWKFILNLSKVSDGVVVDDDGYEKLGGLLRRMDLGSKDRVPGRIWRLVETK